MWRAYVRGRTDARADTHACTHACADASMRARMHARARARTFARTHGRAHAGLQASDRDDEGDLEREACACVGNKDVARICTRTHGRARRHTRMHARMRGREHARAHACTCACAHVRTHARARARGPASKRPRRRGPVLTCRPSYRRPSVFCHPWPAGLPCSRTASPSPALSWPGRPSLPDGSCRPATIMDMVTL